MYLHGLILFYYFSGFKPNAEVEKVVKGRLLLNDVKTLSPTEQTSSLESFHNVVCHFASKAVHYFYAQMEARYVNIHISFDEEMFDVEVRGFSIRTEQPLWILFLACAGPQFCCVDTISAKYFDVNFKHFFISKCSYMHMYKFNVKLLK